MTAPVDMICEANSIEPRLPPNHTLTNGQVEQMNCKIEDALVKRHYDDSHYQLQARLADFLTSYNFAQRLKTLGGLTADEYICKIWATEPD